MACVKSMIFTCSASHGVMRRRSRHIRLDGRGVLQLLVGLRLAAGSAARVAARGGKCEKYGLMASDEVMERVRELRREGCSPKQIARALGMPPSAVAPLVRAVAAAASADTPGPAPALAGCWVSPGWASGLTVDGHPGWPGLPPPAHAGPAGLVTVVAARERGGSKVSACSYLVDVYCLGVKNAIGPHVIDRRKLPEFRFQMFRSYPGPPLEANLELAQNLVFGAVEYARGLGFEPHPDFAACAGHLGEWQGPAVIGFGYQGKPLFIQGPQDDAAYIMKRLRRKAGRDGFHSIAPA
jgi:hypothetical protein